MYYTRPIFAPGMCSMAKLYGSRQSTHLKSRLLDDLFERDSLIIDNSDKWSVNTVKILQ